MYTYARDGSNELDEHFYARGMHGFMHTWSLECPTKVKLMHARRYA